MRRTSLPFVGLALLAVALTAAVAWQKWESWNAASSHPSVVMAPGDEVGVRRIYFKVDVARRLADGQLTLSEAAARFRYIDEATGRVSAEGLGDEPGMSKTELYYRQVIRWAEAEAEAEAQAEGASPGRATLLRRRLSAELEAAGGHRIAVEPPTLH